MSEKENWINEIDTHAYKLTSQAGEDGAIEFVLSHIGEKNRYYVELGAYGGRGDNTEALRSRGWKGLLVGNSGNSSVVREWITVENINEILVRHDVPSEFDLLSVDVDGNDYWVWNEISNRYRPRMVVIEFNANVPLAESKTVKYEAHRRYYPSTYYGASARALYELGRQNNYTLVWQSGCLNLLFVRSDLLPHELREIPLESVVKLPIDVPAFYQRWNCGNLPSWYGLDDGGKEWIDLSAGESLLLDADPALVRLAKEECIRINSEIQGRLCVTPCVHLLYVIKELLGESCGTYLEIGCLHGGTMALVMQVPSRSRFVGIDVFSYYGAPIDPGSGVAVTIDNARNNVRQLNRFGHEYELIAGSSHDPQVIEYVRTKYPSVELLLIDGDHSEEGVVADYHAFAPLVPRGGVLVFDNYLDVNWPGVARGVHSLKLDEWKVIAQRDVMLVLQRK